MALEYNHDTGGQFDYELYARICAARIERGMSINHRPSHLAYLQMIKTKERTFKRQAELQQADRIIKKLKKEMQL